MRVSAEMVLTKLQGRIDAAGLAVTVNDSPVLMAERIAGASVMLACRKLDLREASAASGALAWVQVTNAGVESYLTTLPPGLKLTNASGVHGEKGGEFILAAVMMLNFQIPGFIADKDARRWAPVFGGVIAGKTVTLLGVGGIGRDAARLLQLHGAHVVGVTRGGTAEVPLGACLSVDDLDTVLPDTDFLVSTLPLTSETRGLMDCKRLARLPRGAGVVNVGRAGVFDYDALIEALHDGHLAGAVLDVFPEEPPSPDSPLWSCPRLIMTPHCSVDDHAHYMDRVLDIFARNLIRFIAGEALLNLVDPVRGY